MEKKHRKIYFWFIFTLTVITIPVLLLYSSGYRYNLKQRKIIKTGSIYISSTPKGASIYLNDKLYLSTTPTLINNLFPNEYNIAIKKDGYASWEKKLLVESKKTVFATEIFLAKKNINPAKISKNQFPASPAQEIITADIANTINQLSLSSDLEIKKADNGYLTILDNKNQTLYLIKSDNLSLKIEKLSQTVKGFQWNQKNNNLLLFFNDIEIWVYDVNQAGPELLTRQSEPILEAIWLSENYIIYNETNKIKLMEADSREPRQIYELATVNNAKNLSLDNKEKNLFFEADNNYWQLNLMD